MSAFLLGVVAATASAATTFWTEEGRDEPARVASVGWALVSVDGDHSLTLFTSTGFCVGEERPRLLRPHVVWRPMRAVITARMFFPARHIEPNQACAGIGLGLRRQFHFAHSLTGRALYDGSTSPPQLREPEERR